MNTLTTGKANRQRKNAKKYEVTKIKGERKKEAKAKKVTAKKKAWIAKDKKKNGKVVKGGRSHSALVAEREATTLGEELEERNGIQDSHADSNAPDGGSVGTDGAAV